MYQPGMGQGPVLVGAGVLLPNTGSNTLLTIVSIASIVVGSAIIISSVVRLVAKKAYTKA